MLIIVERKMDEMKKDKINLKMNGLLFPPNSHPDFDTDEDKLAKVKILAHPRLVSDRIIR